MVTGAWESFARCGTGSVTYLGQSLRRRPPAGGSLWWPLRVKCVGSNNCRWKWLASSMVVMALDVSRLVEACGRYWVGQVNTKHGDMAQRVRTQINMIRLTWSSVLRIVRWLSGILLREWGWWMMGGKSCCWGFGRGGKRANVETKKTEGTKKTKIKLKLADTERFDGWISEGRHGLIECEAVLTTRDDDTLVDGIWKGLSEAGFQRIGRGEGNAL